ncbi:MAG: Gfo/Idh/MocA family oxidoreductase [Clostridia bacterium]|nr:Gfo/Idh/MocA family oxidoreductase [Clostridia bacterium]
MKVAVIGLGVIGTHHMNVLAKLGIEVCAVCDTDEDKLAKYPAVAHFTDYRQMIKEAKPDSVHVCTPHYLHAPMVIEALNADINVLCEKPLAINLEELNQILEAEEKSAGILGVCQQNRYNKTNLYIKQLVDAQPDKEKFVGSANVVWNRDKEYYNSAPWRGKWATEGGGVLINQALHTLDIMQWLLGEPTQVTATTANFSLKDVIEVEDTAAAVFTKGGEFSFFATNASSDNMSVEVTLKKPGMEIKTMSDWVAVNGKTISFEMINEYNVKACYGSGHEGLMRDFYECVASGREFAINGREAAKVVRMILAAYASHGNKIDIKR